VKVGVMLPSFQESADKAMQTAQAAEQAELDGVFAFDHVWPMKQPNRPAIAPFPLLSAIAARTESISIGTLVARISLAPEAVLLAELATLAWVAPGRLIAGLGTGDHKSADENDAYGVPEASQTERRSALERLAESVRRLGVPVWIGGGSRATDRMAEESGLVVNLWGATPEEVAEQAARSEVTWAGVAPIGQRGADLGADQKADPSGAVAKFLRALEAAGATWAVFDSSSAIEVLASAALSIRGSPGGE